jgi:putative ABC transport system permease protein
MRAIRTALRSGLAGRRVQALAIGLVLLASAAASTLAAGLLVASDAPFDHAFAVQHGADAALAVNARKATSAELAAAGRLAGVTAAAGPFAEATVSASAAVPDTPGVVFQAFTLAGRSSPGGPVDDIVLSSGHWPTTTGQVVVSRNLADTGSGASVGLGVVITLTGVPGSPKLTVVGVGTSVTNTADGWVLPAQMTALGPPTEQMLYRFASAGSGAAVNAGVAAVTRALPAGSVAGAESWLAVRAQENESIVPWVPFLVTFGVIGLVMSVLIEVNVVSGAVSAGTRRIGVLKSVGFTPAQVVWVYVLQVAAPGVAGVAGGAVIANLLAGPVLGQTSQVFEVAPQSIPLWVDLSVPLAMLALAGVAALAPASRAGRLSAVQAIATGRAPRPSHGYAALRLLGRARVLPRPVTIGLAGPFARPGRTLVTLAAILFGAVAVTFGVGLGTSLNRVGTDLALSSIQHLQIGLAGQQPSPGQPSAAVQQADMAAVIRAQPGTLHYVTESDDRFGVTGMAGTASVTAFGGDASWIGYALISGHWYGPGGAVVNTSFLRATGKGMGDTFTLTDDGRAVALKIAGEVFLPGNDPQVLTNLSSVAALGPSGAGPQMFYVGLRPGVNAQSYQNAVFAKLGPGDYHQVGSGSGVLLQIISGLVLILTLLLVVVAALGVLNTVVLMTRERVHDLGVFKAVGMTPQQVIAMVVTTVAATGLVAGLIAVPAGIALHNAILPIMGNGAQTAFPPGVYNVYSPAELVLLALTGLVIAVVSALAPAGWAAGIRTASALRTELPPARLQSRRRAQKLLIEAGFGFHPPSASVREQASSLSMRNSSAVINFRRSKGRGMHAGEPGAHI